MKYEMELTFLRNVLATNPSDPNVLDTHILDRQRKLILEKQGINTQINKYLEALPIAKEKGEEEVNRLIERLQDLTGYTFNEEERADAIAGKLSSLKETLKELDIKGTTVFFWDKATNHPCIGDHMIYGYLKAAGEAICQASGTRERGVVLQSINKTHSIINQHIRCSEQFIPFDKDIIRREDGTPQYLQRSLRAMTAKGPRISLAKSEQVPAGAKVRFTLNVMDGSPMTKENLCRLFDHGVFFGLGQWRSSGWGTFIYELMQK